MTHGILNTMLRIAREGSLAVVTATAIVGLPCVAAATPNATVFGHNNSGGIVVSHGGGSGSSTGTNGHTGGGSNGGGTSTPTTGNNGGNGGTTLPGNGGGNGGVMTPPSTGNNGGASNGGSSGGGFLSQLLIGAGFAAMWLGGLPIGPGKAVQMSTGERLVKGLGGVGLLAAGAMLLMAGFSSGFGLLGIAEAIGGLGMIAFGLHFGLSALWGKKSSGQPIIGHAGDNSTTTAGNNGGVNAGTIPAGRNPLPSGLGGIVGDGALSHIGGSSGAGMNGTRNASTRPVGATTAVVADDGTAHGGIHH